MSAKPVSTSPPPPGSTGVQPRGTGAQLLGLVLSVLTFWLFAQTALNVGPLMAGDTGIPMPTMNIAISLAALFAGMFVVVAGGAADRVGRVRVLLLGLVVNIVGSLLVGLAMGDAATVMMLVGRALQGLGAALIMPTSLALIKDYWQGPERQKAVSMWSIGTFGGSGLAAIFGGFLAGTVFGWRGIFALGIIVSVIAILLVRTLPESRPAAGRSGGWDIPGILSFVVALLTIQIVVTQGSVLGWTSPVILGCLVAFVVSAFLFFRIESGNPEAFIDFRLFRNRSFTGAVTANLLMNSCIGVMSVALWMLQIAGGMSAATAGYATVGYAVCVIAFIRLGERLLQKLGPRKPMAWGALTMFVAIVLLMATNLYQSSYVAVAVVGFSLFGLGLAFFATPATDTALANLPDAQAGAGAGIFKMASSLGAAFGLAGSTTIFTALEDRGAPFLRELLPFVGEQANVAVREAGMVAIAFNAVMALIALAAIVLIIPLQKRPADVEELPPHPPRRRRWRSGGGSSTAGATR